MDRELFICTLFHHSEELRPQGYEVAKTFYNSWLSLNFRSNLIILDNESTCDYDFVNKDICKFIRIDNQLESGAITGAWNRLTREAINLGADIIMGFNDDVELNNSIKSLAESTTDNNIIYAPLTNGLLNHKSWIKQKSDSIKPNYSETVDSVNGFWISFTSGFWSDKSIDGDLFIKSKAKGCFMNDWEGQECMMNYWSEQYNTKGKIVGDCWIHHTKLRSWKNAKNKYYG